MASSGNSGKEKAGFLMFFFSGLENRGMNSITGLQCRSHPWLHWLRSHCLAFLYDTNEVSICRMICAERYCTWGRASGVRTRSRSHWHPGLACKPCFASDAFLAC